MKTHLDLTTTQERRRKVSAPGLLPNIKEEKWVLRSGAPTKLLRYRLLVRYRHENALRPDYNPFSKKINGCVGPTHPPKSFVIGYYLDLGIKTPLDLTTIQMRGREVGAST